MASDRNYFVHPLADVSTDDIGDGTRIWQFTVVLEGAKIGEDCNICSNTFIENDVEIGDRVTVKNGVQLWDGLRIADDVFIGPNVTFCNDRYPRSRNPDFVPERTLIDAGASIGAGAVVLPGVTIGRAAVIAAGAVVVKDVPAAGLAIGSPSRIVDKASDES